MKKTKLSRMIGLLAITGTMLLMVIRSENIKAQPWPPEHGSSGDQPLGGSAPIGSGLVISLVLGAAYGVKKIYFLWMKDKEKDE